MKKDIFINSLIYICICLGIILSDLMVEVNRQMEYLNIRKYKIDDTLFGVEWFPEIEKKVDLNL